MNKTNDKIVISLDKIPIESSLGLLAIGDIAFEAWRKVKTENNIKPSKL